MNTPGLAILMGGAILLVSELVFLMPIRRKQLNQQKNSKRISTGLTITFTKCAGHRSR